MSTTSEGSVKPSIPDIVTPGKHPVEPEMLAVSWLFRLLALSGIPWVLFNRSVKYFRLTQL